MYHVTQTLHRGDASGGRGGILTSVPVSEQSALPSPWFHSRPPTAVYPDRHQVHKYRKDDFPVTAADLPRVFCINLEGTFFGAGALMELILPVAQAIRSGAYGQAALVVETSDEATVEFLEAVAQRHELSFYVRPSVAAPLRHARPVGPLTKTDAQTLDLLVSVGGRITSAALAKAAGIEPNAAANRLGGLSRKHFIYRCAQGGREGDMFVDPRILADEAANPTIQPTTAAADEYAELVVPDDISDDVRTLAARQGVEPTDVLTQAWQEFALRHRDMLEDDSRLVGNMIRGGDTDALAAYIGGSARARAERAAARLKEDL